jgi:hypothetical protein
MSGRRRRPERPARQRILMMRLGEAEHAALREAAHRAGLTISGYAATASLAAATGQPPPDDRRSERLMAELMATRAQLRRYGNNLNQAARVLNAGGDHPEWLMSAIALADRVVHSIDGAVQELLERPRSSRDDFADSVAECRG